MAVQYKCLVAPGVAVCSESAECRPFWSATRTYPPSPILLLGSTLHAVVGQLLCQIGQLLALLLEHTGVQLVNSAFGSKKKLHFWDTLEKMEHTLIFFCALSLSCICIHSSAIAQS